MAAHLFSVTKNVFTVKVNATNCSHLHKEWMMMRKLSVFGAAVVAGLSFAASSANANVQLYSFEPTDTPNATDGFATNSGRTLTVSESLGVGATQGVGSLELASTSSSFAGALSANVPTVLDNPAVTAISADVTFPALETYTGMNAALLGVTIFAENLTDNPQEFGVQFQVDPGDEQIINTTTSATGNEKTLSIPLTGIDPDSGADESFAQFLANGFVPTGFEFFLDKDAPITVYVDNVQAVGVSVPEPASLGSLAIGGLLLARRRRA